MRSSHSLDRLETAFDDDRLVANAGLLLPATLAQHLGLQQLVDAHLDLGAAPGRANVGDKLLTLIASALAGGDCIDDADALRAGGTASVLGCAVKAPSTLGTFLRSFRWGHVRQLDRVTRELLARAWATGAGPGAAPFTIDLDSTICETYGLAKEGARHHGYTGVRGYHPLLAVAAGSGDVLDRLLGQVEADGAVEELLASVARSAGLPAGGTTAGLVDADEVPDRGDDSDQRASAGQLWALGRHRLLCGDSADPATLRRLLGDERVQMAFLDAPYGVDYRPQRSAGGRPGAAPLQNDDLDAEAYEAWFMRVFAALDLAPGTTVYACHADTMGEIVRRVFRRAGFHHAATLIWAKTHATLGRSDYGWEHEPILFGWRRGAAHRWHGGQKESTVWKFPRDRISGPGESGHPTVKPVSLVERAMLNSSLPEDSVLDPFIGSGTSLIAAERLGRRCFAVEIEPRFVDLAIARWEVFTGRSAELIDG